MGLFPLIGPDGKEYSQTHVYLNFPGSTKKFSRKQRFRLAAHGAILFPAFISMCAETGINTWEVRMDRMTCTYYDKEGERSACGRDAAERASSGV